MRTPEKPRVVVFGATGFTGQITVGSLIELGIRPLLVGRDQTKLEKVSEEHGGLETARAEVGDAASLEKLLGPGDILISTVGPFARFGDTAVQAAISAGAHYIDSTGEIAFARKVVEHYGPMAEKEGISLHTTAGYDFVPGNCVAAVALERAGLDGVRVEVGYFASQESKLEISQGTRASIVDATLEPGLFWKKGRRITRTAGTRLRRFQIDGKRRPAVSISGSEHLFLPRHYPQLQDINTYLGWFGKKSYFMQPLALFSVAAFKIPGLRRLCKYSLSRMFKSRGKGPGARNRSSLGSHIIAIVFDEHGKQLSMAELLGANGYDFTADFIASIADEILAGNVRRSGALSPIDAFGLEKLIALCAKAGLDLK